MAPFIFIASIFCVVVAAALVWFLGMSLLEKIFGTQRLERYLKWRMQGPYVPTPTEKNSDGAQPLLKH